jgi:hypothetical protein
MVCRHKKLPNGYIKFPLESSGYCGQTLQVSFILLLFCEDDILKSLPRPFNIISFELFTAFLNYTIYLEVQLSLQMYCLCGKCFKMKRIAKQK